MKGIGRQASNAPEVESRKRFFSVKRSGGVSRKSFQKRWCLKLPLKAEQEKFLKNIPARGCEIK